jgi:hypothetical protein
MLLYVYEAQLSNEQHSPPVASTSASRACTSLTRWASPDLSRACEVPCAGHPPNTNTQGRSLHHEELPCKAGESQPPCLPLHSRPKKGIAAWPPKGTAAATERKLLLAVHCTSHCGVALPVARQRKGKRSNLYQSHCQNEAAPLPMTACTALVAPTCTARSSEATCARRGRLRCSAYWRIRAIRLLRCCRRTCGHPWQRAGWQFNCCVAQGWLHAPGFRSSAVCQAKDCAGSGPACWPHGWAAATGPLCPLCKAAK